MKNPLKKGPKPSITYTPFDLSDAVPAGRRRFWKQVLPNTTINYQGKKIKFDKRYHMDLADSFRKEAFDQVPVVFATGENKHNMDPRNFGGDVLDMQVRPDGLFALVEADKKAAKQIQRNPRLGVSARIRQGVEKADGRMFDRAIEHLCLTMNPRVTGMSPWEAAVDLSDEDADIIVVDLTTMDYEKGSDMKGTRKQSASSKKPQRALTGTIDLATIDLSELDDDQFQALLDLSTAVAEDETTDTDADKDKNSKESRRSRRKKSRTKIVIDKDAETDDPDDDLNDDDNDGTDLSDADKAKGKKKKGKKTTVDLAAREGLTQMRLDLAEERWDREREDYVEAGVPAFLVDLAEPVLSLPDAMTIDLSDDETVDATSIIREMLDGARGIVDLTGEFGSAVDLTADDEVKSDTDKVLAEWDTEYSNS